MKPLTAAILLALSCHAQATSPALSPNDGTDPPAERGTTESAPAAPDYLVPSTLDTLRVIGQRLFPYQEGMVLDQKYIDAQAKGNGDIGTLLRINPNVQFDDTAVTSRNMGEIRPADISINGGLFYQNAFLLDGANFNNDLNPIGGEIVPTHIMDVPSYSQGIALDSSLIGNLTVYDSNVPAAFGGFNGGVIDAESRKARDAISGKLAFRMSRSVWNRYHIARDKQQSFEESFQASDQPRYDKYQINAVLEGRTRSGLGIIGNISRTRSVIPLRGYSAGFVSANDEFEKEQTRENTNLSVRLDWEGPNGLELGASITHAPTDERYFIYNTKNGYFDLKQGGPVASFRANLELGAWTLRNTLSYSDVESSRRGQSGINHWKNWAWSDQFDWGARGSSQEGNWGNIDQTSRNIAYRLLLERAALRWGFVEHHLQLGAEVQDRKATYERLNDHLSWLRPESTRTCTSTNGVVDNEGCSLSPVRPGASIAAGRGQYFRQLDTYRAGYFEAEATEWSVFLQDDVRLGRWSIRPGVRVDGDDIVDEVTVSPRLALSWDVFDNKDTLLTAGANRYYGRSFFNYLLREGRERLKSTQQRGANLVWSPPVTSTANYRFKDLRVPYSDELNLGINQRFHGLDLNFKYVRREGRDEVVRTRRSNNGDGDIFSRFIYEYTNDGRSSGDVYTLSIAPLRAWQGLGASTHAQFAFDYTEVRRNYQNYEESFSEEAFNAWVRYNGSLIHAYELPAISFNRPWTARLATQSHWESAGLMWSNFLRYRAGYRSTRTVGKEEFQGESINVVEDYDYPDSLTWDSTLEWTLGLARGQETYVRMEVQNVLDRVTLIRNQSTGDYYEPGRSYWFEVGYRF